MEAQDGGPSCRQRIVGHCGSWYCTYSMVVEDWMKLDRKEKSTIWLCLSDSVLLNVSGEATTKELWDKLGTLYQSKSLVNKLFLRKKLYLLRMNDGDSMIEHLNSFNTMW
jgi:hypothetical protein